MLDGLPSDFPNSFKPQKQQINTKILQDEKFNCSNALFIRNIELDEKDMNKSLLCKSIIECEDVIMNEITIKTENLCKRKNNLFDELFDEINDLENNKQKHVKFSTEPPIEFVTFPDSEYDRTSSLKIKGRDYYAAWKAKEMINSYK